MKPLSDDAIKRNWVEVEHQLGFTSVGEDEYKDFYFDHNRPLARKAEDKLMEQVDDWFHDIFYLTNPRIRKAWQEFKKQAEAK